MERTNKALFCDKCSLQFDKKIVYDMHLSIIHKTKAEKVEQSIEFWEENQSFMLNSDNTKSNMYDLSLNLNHKETRKKPHECSICDYTSSKKGNLKKKPLNQFMWERNHTNVQFVITPLQKKET